MLFQCWRCNNMLASCSSDVFESFVERSSTPPSTVSGECEGASGVWCFGTSFHLLILINMLQQV